MATDVVNRLFDAECYQGSPLLTAEQLAIWLQVSKRASFGEYARRGGYHRLKARASIR
ncbi:MAG: hypothetical protein U1D30_10915 [Planctomycetota bacterium]